MKAIFFTLSFICATITILSSCNKQEKNFDYPMGSFFEKYSEKSQKFVIHADKENLISTMSSDFTIPANAFETQEGKSISGKVTVYISQIKTRSDMILNNKTCTENGKLLQSGGELFIEAYQNNDKLKLKSTATISIDRAVTFFTDNMTSMRGYSGTIDESNGEINWTEDSINFDLTMKSSSAGMPMFTGDIGLLGWINWDQPYNEDTVCSISINVVDYNKYDEIVGFFEVKNENVVGNLKFDASSTTYHMDYVPSNKDSRILIIAKKGITYYFVAKEIKINEDSSLSLELASSTEEKIVEIIKGYDYL